MLDLILKETHSSLINGEEYFQKHGAVMRTKKWIVFCQYIHGRNLKKKVNEFYKVTASQARGWQRYIDDAFSLWDYSKKLTNSTLLTRLLSLIQWYLKENKALKNPSRTSKRTTNRQRPFNIHTSPHATHQALK